MGGYPSAIGAWDASAGAHRDARGDAFPARRDVGAEKSAVLVLDGRAQAGRWRPVARQFAVEAEPGQRAALCTPGVGPSAEQSFGALAPPGAEWWLVERS